MSENDQQSLQALHAYAYLTASFRTHSKTADIIDCLTPFVSAAIMKDHSEPVAVERVANNLAEFGLEIPLYAIEQMLPRLRRDGVIEWNDVAKRLIPVPTVAQERSQFPQLPEAFGSLELLMSDYARELGVDKPPLSEPPRDCRRPFGLSYAAMGLSSSMA
jgi:hypothetical protein